MPLGMTGAKDRVSAIADGEKIQIGEQLDWRALPERTGGNRPGRASRAAIPLEERALP